jgi:hypothetical protein
LCCFYTATQPTSQEGVSVKKSKRPNRAASSSCVKEEEEYKKNTVARKKKNRQHNKGGEGFRLPGRLMTTVKRKNKKTTKQNYTIF